MLFMCDRLFMLETVFIVFTKERLFMLFRFTRPVCKGSDKKVLDDLKDRRGYCHSKEEALDRTVWRIRFGRGFGPVVRTEYRRNECININYINFILFYTHVFLFCIIFFLFKWLCWMVTLL
jgi:hypothetical protein